MSATATMPTVGLDLDAALAQQGKRGAEARKAAASTKIETPVVETAEVATDIETTEKASVVVVEKGRVARSAGAVKSAVKEYTLLTRLAQCLGMIAVFVMLVAATMWVSHRTIGACRGEVERQNAVLQPYLAPADLAAARAIAYPGWYDPRHYFGTPEIVTGLVTTLKVGGKDAAYSYSGKWVSGSAPQNVSLPRI